MEFYRLYRSALQQRRMGKDKSFDKAFCVYRLPSSTLCHQATPFKLDAFSFSIQFVNLVYKCRLSKMMAITCEWFCCWLRHVSYSAINYNFGVVFCSSPEPPNYDTKACLLPVSFGRIFCVTSSKLEARYITYSLTCIYERILLGSVLILAQKIQGFRA